MAVLWGAYRRYTQGFLGATKERGLTLAQTYAALYGLTQSVTLEPGPKARVQLAVRVGLRDEYHCEDCSDLDKECRGYCPFVEGSKAGTVATYIDSTDNETHDAIYACPMGLQIDEVYAREDVSLWHRLTAVGGPGVHYRDALESLPPYVENTLSLLAAIESRFGAEVMRQRRELDKRG